MKNCVFEIREFLDFAYVVNRCGGMPESGKGAGLKNQGHPVSAGCGGSIPSPTASEMPVWRNWQPHQLCKLASGDIAGSNPATGTILYSNHEITIPEITGKSINKFRIGGAPVV